MDIFQPFMFNRNKCKCGLNKDDECHTKQNVCIICGESYTAVTGFQILHHQVFGLQLCSGYKFLDFLHAAPARYQSDWHTEPSDTPVQGFRNPTLSPLYEHTLKNSIMQVYIWECCPNKTAVCSDKRKFRAKQIPHGYHS